MQVSTLSCTVHKYSEGNLSLAALYSQDALRSQCRTSNTTAGKANSWVYDTVAYVGVTINASHVWDCTKAACEYELMASQYRGPSVSWKIFWAEVELSWFGLWRLYSGGLDRRSSESLTFRMDHQRRFRKCQESNGGSLAMPW